MRNPGIVARDELRARAGIARHDRHLLREEPTLLGWHENFENGWPSIKHRYDERFYRMWRYYLLICAGAFRSGNFRLWQTVFGKGYEGVYQAAR